MSAPHDEQTLLQQVTRQAFLRRVNAQNAAGPALSDHPALLSALQEIGTALQVRITLEDLGRMVAEARSAEALSATMAAQEEAISPELARSLQAEENWWRKIEADHQMLSSTGVSLLLGKKPNRTYASHQRNNGRLLGYRRGNSYRFPKFQFDLHSRIVRPVITDLLQLTRGYGMSDEELVMWLCTPSGYFEEQDEPVHHLDDHEAMLDAAEVRFGPSW